MEGDVITLQDLFIFDYQAGFDDDGPRAARCARPGCARSFLDKLAASGVHVDTSDVRVRAVRGAVVSLRAKTWARAGATVGIAGAALLVAAPAATAADGRISEVDPTPTGVRIVFGPAGALPPSASFDPKTVSVTVAGEPVPATAAPFGTTPAPARRSVLVMDISGSMAGVRIGAARSAAASYLRALPLDVEVAVVTFADRAAVLVAPTKDRPSVIAAVTRLQVQPNGGTALYEGAALGVKTAGHTAVRSLLVLSDGADDGTRPPTLAQAAAAVKASGVTLDAVSLGAGTQVASLRALAAAGGGRAVAAQDAAALTTAFTAAAAAVTSQIVVDASVPGSVPRGSQDVSVSASAGGSTYTDHAVVLLAAPTATPLSRADQFGARAVPAATSSLPGWVLPAALFALFLGLAALLAIAFAGSPQDTEKGRIRRRLAAYSLAPRPTQGAATTSATTSTVSSGSLGDTPVARSAVELAGRITGRGDVDSMLAGRLESAGLPLKPAEWALIHVGATLGLGLLLLVITDFSLLPAAIGMAIGFGAPYAYLSYRTGRRQSAFEDAMPDTLQLLAGSLSAGYSLPQAVDTVSRESQGVMSSELNHAIVAARLGVPLEEALDEIATRMGSKDWSWVVMAIRINREVGGNLAEVLTTVAATMRERERLRRQVRALSAEGRLSAAILGALPLVFAVYLILVRPEYIGLLTSNVVGLAMIVVGVVLLLVGFVWLRKVVTVEV